MHLNSLLTFPKANRYQMDALKSGTFIGEQLFIDSDMYAHLLFDMKGFEHEHN